MFTSPGLGVCLLAVYRAFVLAHILPYSKGLEADPVKLWSCSSPDFEKIEDRPCSSCPLSYWQVGLLKVHQVTEATCLGWKAAAYKSVSRNDIWLPGSNLVLAVEHISMLMIE